jgi:hypothetical protein
LVAGDPEKANMNRASLKNGISYHRNQIDYVLKLAKDLNIDPPKYRPDEH